MVANFKDMDVSRMAKCIDGFNEFGDWKNDVDMELMPRAKKTVYVDFAAATAQSFTGIMRGESSLVLHVTTNTGTLILLHEITGNIKLYDESLNLIETILLRGAIITAAGTAFFNEVVSSVNMNYAHKYVLTIESDTACSLNIKIARLSMPGDNAISTHRSLESETDSEWVILPDGNTGCSVSLDCTGAGVSGYVEATVDKSEVDSGGTPVAETWPLGTITNTIGHAELAKAYAVRFVVTAGAGHRLLVRT